MTPEEQRISDCLDEVFNYCKQHKGSCEGCILYRQIEICGLRIAYCRLQYAPEIFGESEK